MRKKRVEGALCARNVACEEKEGGRNLVCKECRGYSDVTGICDSQV